MKIISQFILIITCIINIYTCQAMIEKGAGMSSEQALISINKNETTKTYQKFTQHLIKNAEQELEILLKKSKDSLHKEKLENIKSEISSIITSMGTLKFIVTFGGLPKHAQNYINIKNDTEKLTELLKTLQNNNLDIAGIMSRFIYVYDHNGFAGDLDEYSSAGYLMYSNSGTYLIRISQKHSPGGFTFSYTKNNMVEHRCGFFFTGNNLEIKYGNKLYANLTDVINQFFAHDLKEPATIYGISLGNFWRTKNKY